MFVKNSTQESLFQTRFVLSGRIAKILRSLWVEIFRRDVLPHIPEDHYAHLYCKNNGRPNFPIAILVGLSLIKELFHWTDEQIFNAFHFDILVHHALGIPSGEITLSERTLYNFRSRVAGDCCVPDKSRHFSSEKTPS